MDSYTLLPIALRWIVENIPDGATILELGSGKGSEVLYHLGYKVFSVEEDIQWVNKYHGVTYIHAPIENNWYNLLAMKSIPKKYDLLIIDGPKRGWQREGILDHLDLFNWSVPVLIDDFNRPEEHAMAIQLRSAMGLSHKYTGKYPKDKISTRTFAVYSR